MATICSTGFRRLILGPASFESIFNGGQGLVYSGPQPETADSPITGSLLAMITAPGGLNFQRIDYYARNAHGQTWTLNGVNTGIAGWVRLIAAGTDNGGASSSLPRIDFAIGLDGGAPGDFQMLLPTLSITPTTAIAVSSWWFQLPPL